MPNTNEIVRISSEWLDANKSRAYPFDDSCAAAPGALPTDLFTDAFFSLSGVSGESLYISKIILGQTSFQVYAATESYDLGLIADIPYSTPERAQVLIDLSTDEGVTLSGLLVVGDAMSVKRMYPVNEMSLENGKFFYGCVREFIGEGVTGIKIGDRVYRGVVNLVAGEGIEFDVTEEPGETTIRMAAKERQIPKENMIIVDDTTLLAELTRLYGAPVLTINGRRPDSSGNIILAYPDDAVKGQGYSPFPTDVGTIILQDASGATGTCENTLVETLMANIAELNDRSARQAETLSAIDTANNVMSVALSRIS